MAVSSYIYRPLRTDSTAVNEWTIKSLNWKDFGLLMLGVSNIGFILNFLSRTLTSMGCGNTEFSYGALDLKSERRIQNYTWWSKYSQVEQESGTLDDLWDKIVPSHGIVAVELEWAARKNLPETMQLPSNLGKGVYVIDAYHQLHCLTIVRKTFYEVLRGDKLTYPTTHAIHYFDSIRQYIQCTAGDTLLYSWGRNVTGDGQNRKCRDWDALREWASQHSACYKDSTDPIPLLEHFGHCDGSTTDGLEDI